MSKEWLRACGFFPGEDADNPGDWWSLNEHGMLALILSPNQPSAETWEARVTEGDGVDETGWGWPDDIWVRGQVAFICLALGCWNGEPEEFWE